MRRRMRLRSRRTMGQRKLEARQLVAPKRKRHGDEQDAMTKVVVIDWKSETGTRQFEDLSERWVGEEAVV
jgi:hypothetical protein